MRVFVSGSRYYSNMGNVEKELSKHRDDEILVGDCYGVDAEVQRVCRDLNITCYVFHIGNCRNNIGNHQTMMIMGDRYSDKDAAMTVACDEGLVFWNGTSRGSAANIERLKKMGKEVKIIK